MSPRKKEQRHVLIRGHVFKWEEKEPFVQSGVSVAGAVEYDFANDKLRCHECGEWFLNLGSHIAQYHQMKTEEYRLKHGLNLYKNRTALVSLAMSKALSKSSKKAVRRLPKNHPFKMAQKGDSALRNGTERDLFKIKRIGGRKRTCHPDMFDPNCDRCLDRVRSQQRRERIKADKIAKAQALVRADRPSNWKSSKYEKLNEIGRCEAQAIFRIRKLVAELGRYPTLQEITDSGLNKRLLSIQFGGSQGVKDKIGYVEEDTKTKLIKSIRLVAAEVGHTPRASDLQMFGVNCNTVARHFGSVIKAQEKAGLYPNNQGPKVMPLPEWFSVTEALGEEKK